MAPPPFNESNPKSGFSTRRIYPFSLHIEPHLWHAPPLSALPGFGRTPTVRQLRITDSPFPLREIEEDHRVDEAAEKFITKFYRDLKKQNGA